MKLFLLHTTRIVKIKGVFSDPTNIHAPDVFASIAEKGKEYNYRSTITEGERNLLLIPHISIVDPYGKAEISFIYPGEQKPTKEIIVTQVVIKHDPIEIKFHVTVGALSGEYKITQNQENGCWTAYFIQNNEAIFVMEGTLYK